MQENDTSVIWMLLVLNKSGVKYFIELICDFKVDMS